MNMNPPIEEGLLRRKRIACLVLAALATTISIALSTITGWQLGESLFEKLLYVAFGVLVVLGAHSLLVLYQFVSTAIRLIVAMFWLVCMGCVLWSHASFFLTSQQQVGLRRAAIVDQSSSTISPTRTLAAILSEQAVVKTELAAKSQTRCSERSCPALKVKIVNLAARLDALTAEADEVKRGQLQQDRQSDLKESVRDDPATTRLAVWLGVTVSQMGLVRGLLFSIILEGMGCLCWYVGLQSRDSPVTQAVIPLVATVTEPPEVVAVPVIAPVTAVSKPVTGTDQDDTQELSASDQKQLEELIRMSTEKKKDKGRELSIKEIRDYCNFAQKKASKFKKLVVARLEKETQAGLQKDEATQSV